jgi:hypothetical protein
MPFLVISVISSPFNVCIDKDKKKQHYIGTNCISAEGWTQNYKKIKMCQAENPDIFVEN